MSATANLSAEDRVLKLVPIPDKLVVLTIDDCNKSDRSFVAEEVKKHGFGATFFVTEGLGFLKNKKHYTTWDEIAELHRMGFEIGNHTRSHPNLTGLSREQILEEIEDRKSTRLNSSHKPISYAVFCLKKKTTNINSQSDTTTAHSHTN